MSSAAAVPVTTATNGWLRYGFSGLDIKSATVFKLATTTGGWRGDVKRFEQQVEEMFKWLGCDGTGRG